MSEDEGRGRHILNDGPGWESAWPPLQSQLPGVVWPAIPGQQGLLLAALLKQLDQSQWLPAAELEWMQMRQLGVLLEHARRIAVSTLMDPLR